MLGTNDNGVGQDWRSERLMLNLRRQLDIAPAAPALPQCSHCALWMVVVISACCGLIACSAPSQPAASQFCSSDRSRRGCPVLGCPASSTKSRVRQRTMAKVDKRGWWSDTASRLPRLCGKHQPRKYPPVEWTHEVCHRPRLQRPFDGRP